MERIVQKLKENWQFSRGEIPGASEFDCRYREWKVVRVPHDYAIEGPFDPHNDKGNLMASADGFPAVMGATGRTGALPLAGTAWYRKELFIEESWQGREISLEFDGIMSHSEIFINGKLLHKNVYGYTSFRVDISDAVCFGKSNLLAVRVSQNPWESRWYPGAGIYRNVRLTVKSDTNISFHSVYITTPRVSEKEAAVLVKTGITKPCTGLTLSVTLLAPDGSLVAAEEVSAEKAEAVANLSVIAPQLWSDKEPALYKACLELKKDGEVLDAETLRVGIRSVVIDREKGLFVNGAYTKLKGVCMHHDLGAIGAAVNESALRRQFRILADMGCNAIRTSHNPPAPEVLELADELGFYIIDEAFDQWKKPKTTNGYSMYFDMAAEADLTALIRRDRSHPSVILWSIGNEVGDQCVPEGGETAKFLVDICHREDPSRLVTCGFDMDADAWTNGLISAVDVVGLNYRRHWYNRAIETFGKPIYGSETSSCVSSRGVYYIPEKEPRANYLDENQFIPKDWEYRSWAREAHVEVPPPIRDEGDVNSYDLSAPAWAYYPEVEFGAQEDLPQLLGEFVWTGFDYLGEPTPYGISNENKKLCRSSYFGIVDLAGIPKDRFWSYQTQWTDKPVLHLFPHWNWKSGDVLPVCCYTSFDRAELFVNGRSYGICEKKPGSEKVLERYRLMWENVAFEPGILEVRALDAAGNVQMTETVRTAGLPAEIILSLDRENYTADGEDLCYVTAKVVDKDGNLCPLADTLLTFTVSGCGEFVATDNGCQTDLMPFQSPERNAYNGYAVGIFQTRKEQAGEMRICVSAEGLPAARITAIVKCI